MKTKPLPRSARFRQGLVIAALGVLTLSGCSSDIHPGLAATVDDTSITQGTVDDTVSSLCNYLEAANEANASPQLFGVADLRATVTSALISFQLLDTAAAELDLTIEPADVQALATQTVLPEGLDSSDTKLLQTFFDDGAKSQVVTQTIGANLKDPTVTSSADAGAGDAQDADKYVSDYFADSDVVINPAYGTWDGSTVSPGSGSLSDPVSAVARAALPKADGTTDVAGLPPSQVCG